MNPYIFYTLSQNDRVKQANFFTDIVGSVLDRGDKAIDFAKKQLYRGKVKYVDDQGVTQTADYRPDRIDRFGMNDDEWARGVANKRHTQEYVDDIGQTHTFKAREFEGTYNDPAMDNAGYFGRRVRGDEMKFLQKLDDDILTRRFGDDNVPIAEREQVSRLRNAKHQQSINDEALKKIEDPFKQREEQRALFRKNRQLDKEIEGAESAIGPRYVYNKNMIDPEGKGLSQEDLAKMYDENKPGIYRSGDTSMAQRDAFERRATEAAQEHQKYVKDIEGNLQEHRKRRDRMAQVGAGVAGAVGAGGLITRRVLKNRAGRAAAAKKRNFMIGGGVAGGAALAGGAAALNRDKE